MLFHTSPKKNILYRFSFYTWRQVSASTFATGGPSLFISVHGSSQTAPFPMAAFCHGRAVAGAASVSDARRQKRLATTGGKK
jgi:hypothetical protein